jgi:hypothetical protein
MSDPPDANDEAAGIMTDISHNAWHSFTRHILKTARPSSLSSFNDARPTQLPLPPCVDVRSHALYTIAYAQW